MLQEARDECRQLTREQLDKVVMGQLRVLCHRDPLTQKNKDRNSARKRTCTSYHFQGHRVCRYTFLFLHTMKALKCKPLAKFGGNIGIFGLKAPLHVYVLGEHTSMKKEL